MANPFTTGPFNCCTCPEPDGYDPATDDPLPKYKSKCGSCPSVEITCVSEEKDAELCGWPEWEDVEADPPILASVPPKKYLALYDSVEKDETDRWRCCSGSRVKSFERRLISKRINSSIYDGESCVRVNQLDQEGAASNKGWNCASELVTDYEGGIGYAGVYTVRSTISTTLEQDYALRTYNFPDTGYPGCEGQVSETREVRRTYELDPDTEDTEEDALDRATPTVGTSCNSIYEYRTTSFEFTVRTVTYTAVASGLIPGVEYTGCIRIQKREAYSGTEPEGADTDTWIDVEPDTIAAFTATATEEEVAADVALPGGTEESRGYEYRIAGAYVWPTSAGCDCPTSYEPEE